MWIQTTDGMLVNSDYIQTIYREDNAVMATMASEIGSTILAECDDSNSALRMEELIVRAITNEMRFVLLDKSAGAKILA